MRWENGLLFELEMFVFDARLVFLLRSQYRSSELVTYWRKLTCIRLTALPRSSGVRNHAFVGESGKRNLEECLKRCVEYAFMRPTSTARPRSQSMIP